MTTEDIKKPRAAIIGTGFCVPERVMTNHDLEKIVDTSDQWIVERTGIKERHIAAADVATSDIAYEAARKALANAGVAAAELDLIIVATLTPDHLTPSTASLLQKRLGADHAAAFDLQSACSGFVYGAAVAAQFIENGFYRKILVIGAEILSKYINWEDRNTCVLFGDGAGAAVFAAAEDGSGILSCDLGSDGRGPEVLGIPGGGTRYPADEDTIARKVNRIHMEGKEVFRFAVKVLPATLKRSLERAGVTADELTWIVPHQANIRIIEGAAKRLAMPLERFIVNIEHYGNMSAASVPLALAEADAAGKFKKGDLVAMAGFGAGLTWASCVMRWAK